MIEITGIDLKEFAKKVYELSSPQGMGFLHFTPAPLSDERAKEIINRFVNDKWAALRMDYVDGRACKMVVKKIDGKLFINDNWYDHTDEQLQELLEALKIK